MRLIYLTSLIFILTVCFAKETQARKPAVEPTMNYNVSDVYTPNKKINKNAPKFDFTKEKKLDVQRDLAQKKALYIPKELEDTSHNEKIPFALIILLLTIPVGLVIGVQISTYVRRTSPQNVPDNVVSLEQSRNQKVESTSDDHINKAS